MNRQQLAHLLRAASQIAGDANVLVLGSQAILGSFDEDDLPLEATASMEADIAFIDDPDRTAADLVEGALGELSSFHEANGFYAEGIHVDTAVLPTGWRARLVGWDLSSSDPAQPKFLDRHDLAVAKLAAGREKDFAFVRALLCQQMLDPDVIRARVALLPAWRDPRVGERILSWLSSA